MKKTTGNIVAMQTEMNYKLEQKQRTSRYVKLFQIGTGCPSPNQLNIGKGDGIQ